MVTDIEVLAENAAQIAAGKEYRARTSLTNQDAFFSKMSPNGANERFIADAAKT